MNPAGSSSSVSETKFFVAEAGFSGKDVATYNPPMMTHRRDVLRAGAVAPLGLLALVGDEAKAASPAAPPPYTLSINIEIMFNTGRGNPPMPRADRIRAVAAKGSARKRGAKAKGAKKAKRRS